MDSVTAYKTGIKRARGLVAVSQKTLAEASGLKSPQHINKIENRGGLPRPDSASRIHAALKSLAIASGKWAGEVKKEVEALDDLFRNAAPESLQESSVKRPGPTLSTPQAATWDKFIGRDAEKAEISRFLARSQP